jgi:hypothetical protein
MFSGESFLHDSGEIVASQKRARATHETARVARYAFEIQ